MTTDLVSWARSSIPRHAEAAAKLVTAVKECQRLSELRAGLKVLAVERLKEGQGWSQTQADKLTQYDPEYAQYKTQVAEAELHRLSCALDLQNAELSARFHIASLSASAEPTGMTINVVREGGELGET